MDLVQTFAEYAQSVVDDGVRRHLEEVVFVGITTGGAYLLAARNTARAIHSGRFSGPQAKIQTTSYVPALEAGETAGQWRWIVNPATQQGFVDQLIRVEDKPLNLREIFNKAVAAKFTRYIEQAAHYTTKDAPLILSHLDRVIPAQDRETVLTMMSVAFKGYFSGLYRDTRSILTRRLGPGERLEESTLLPALIREAGAQQEQYRILLIHLDDRGSFDLPDFADVRFEMPDGRFAHDTDSVQDDRYWALHGIKSFLESDRGPVHVARFGIELPTGRILQAGIPAMAAGAPVV